MQQPGDVPQPVLPIVAANEVPRHPEHVPAFVEALRQAGWWERHRFLNTPMVQNHVHKRWLFGMLRRRMGPDELIFGRATGRRAHPVIVLRDRPRYRQAVLAEYFRRRR